MVPTRPTHFALPWLLLAALPAAAAPGPALSVDAASDRHPISPLIYGMAYPDPALAKEISLPINRWGGDATTRYNWQVDSSNSGDDWFFMAGGSANPTPGAGPDALVTFAKSVGGSALLTVPIIDYVNKATAIDCTFPVSIFGPQQKVNPYVHPVVNSQQTDAGNGRKPDGTPIHPTREQILRVHVPNTPALQKAWVAHLVQKFGPGSKGGVPIYELDNEPDGWNNTHRDIHPAGTGHEELAGKSIAYATAIKDADPTAAVLGPGGFMYHYQNEGIPGDGKKEHNNLGQASYYLQQMNAASKKAGKRLLDYFDEHFYPLPQEGQSDAILLDSTRSLWDPTYVEADWYGKYNGAVDLIPSMHRWVDQYCPGTRISISEYGWGNQKTLVGALALCDVLGIFGRERLDLACLFGPPKAAEAGANAFRLYQNYDGKGGRYGETWIRSASADQGKLAIYGSLRASDGALTIVVVNKAVTELTSPIAIKGFDSGARAAVYRYSAANSSSVVRDADIPLQPAGLSATFPARSATLLVLPKR